MTTLGCFLGSCKLNLAGQGMQTASLESTKAEEHKAESEAQNSLKSLRGTRTVLCAASHSVHESRGSIRGTELSGKGWEGEERRLDCEDQDTIGIM